MYAAISGSYDVVSILMRDPRVLVNSRDITGNTAFKFATEYGHTELISKMLSDPRIVPNTVDTTGSTTLIHTIISGHLPSAELLLADGRVDPNTENKDGHTALYYAARAGNIRMMETLLSEPRVERIRPVVGGNDYDFALEKVISRSRYWGLFRAIVLLRCLRLRASERAYAPGGAGFLAAAESFQAAVAATASSNNNG